MLASHRGRLSGRCLALLSIVAFGVSACGSSSDSGDTPVSESGANGIAVLFANTDDTRELGGTATPVQLGDGGTVVSGTQNGKASTVLVFQQGKALVVMQFDSAPDDPVPADLITAVGQKQADAIKSGLTE